MPVEVKASKVIDTLVGEKGYHEGRSNGHWNNDQKYSDETPTLEWSDWMAWCCTFVVWGFHKAGDRLRVPVTASCLTAVNTYRQWKRFSWYPATGAQVFFGKNGGSHTGLVTRWNSTHIWTIEGNTNDSGSPEGDGVYEKSYRRDNPYVYGYGYPKYDHAMDSADPGWKEPGKNAEKPSKDKPSAGSGKPSTPARYRVTINGLEYGYGAKGAHVTEVGKELVRRGFGKHYKEGPGPEWSDADTLNYADYQESLGHTGKDADGVPGEGSLKDLLGKLPSKVKPKCPAFPGRQYFRLGAKNTYARQLQTWLDEGDWGPKYTVGPSNTMTQKDLNKVAALQRHYLSALGPADGLTGPKTWQYAFEVANGLRKK